MHSVVVGGVALLSATALACAENWGRGTIPEEPFVTADGLHQVDHRAGGVLFVKPDHQIASYDALLIEPVEVSFDRSSRRLTAAETQRIKDYLRDAMHAGVEASGIGIATEPAPCALRVELSLIDLHIADQPEQTAAATAFVSSWGKVLLVQELSDSVSGEPLLRFGERRKIEGGVYYGQSGSIDWRRVTRTFDAILADLQIGLINTVPLSTVPQHRPACRGALGIAIGVPQTPPGQAAP